MDTIFASIFENSETGYKIILENISDAVICFDKTGKIVFWNAAATKAFGFDCPEIYEKNIIELFNTSKATSPIDVFINNNKIDLKYDKLSIEAIARNKNDDNFPVEYSFSELTVNGTVIAIMILRDISNQKSTENEIARRTMELIEEKERTQQYLNIAAIMFIVLDKNGSVTFANKKSCEILGYSNEEILGKNWFSTFLPEKNKASNVVKFNNIMECSEPLLYFENQVLTKNGEEKLIAWHNNYIPDASGNITGIIWSGEDITEKQKLLDNLNRTQKLESLGLLAGGIAHDFNNLLNGVFGYIDLARESCSPEDKIKNYLDKALKAYDRAKSLTQQLLTFAKGGAPIRNKAVISTLIITCTQFSLSGSSISAEFQLAPDLWPCNYDKDQMAQAINNLVINAKDAMPNGGTIKISACNISLQEYVDASFYPGNYIKITIKDQGTGIPEDLLGKIFDPFFSTKQQGHGIGLTTVYSIVKKHNGFVEVESKEGIGSEFHIYLPASYHDPNNTEGPLPGSTDTIGNMLVMDDEEFMLDLAGIILKKHGFAVSLAKDGDEAISIYKKTIAAGKKFELIILDLTIPGSKGGLETIKELRAIDAIVPVVVSSGYSEGPVMSAPAAYGFAGKLEKPFNKKELLTLLKQLDIYNGTV